MRLSIFIGLWFSALVAMAQGNGDVSLPNVVTRTMVRVGDQSDQRPLLIIFTSNQCPFDKVYRERLLALAADTRVRTIFVNAHVDEAESADAMKAEYGTWKTTVPYLADKDQVLMRQLDARKSPEAFLFRPGTGLRALFFRGTIDDNPQSAQDVRAKYLQDAVETLLTGGPAPVSQPRATGCSIRPR